MQAQEAIIIVLLILLAVAAYVIYDAKSKTQPSVASASVVGPHTPTEQVAATTASPPVTLATVAQRDYRVLDDPLYPALARQDAEGTARLMNEPRLRAEASRGDNDLYRLVGYLVSQEEKQDAWKLYARQTQGPGRSLADFYAEPANRDLNGLKIALSQPGVSAPPLRDVYNIPSEVNIRHPLFNSSTEYTVVELPPPSLGSPYF